MSLITTSRALSTGREVDNINRNRCEVIVTFNYVDLNLNDMFKEKKRENKSPLEIQEVIASPLSMDSR